MGNPHYARCEYVSSSQHRGTAYRIDDYFSRKVHQVHIDGIIPAADYNQLRETGARLYLEGSSSLLIVKKKK